MTGRHFYGLALLLLMPLVRVGSTTRKPAQLRSTHNHGNESGALEARRCCPCDNNTISPIVDKPPDLHSESIQHLRKLKLARDARLASGALTFLFILIMVSVLYSRMWRNNEGTSKDLSSENITASEAFENLHRKYRGSERTSRSRKRKKKQEPQHILLLSQDSSSDNDQFYV